MKHQWPLSTAINLYTTYYPCACSASAKCNQPLLSMTSLSQISVSLIRQIRNVVWRTTFWIWIQIKDLSRREGSLVFGDKIVSRTPIEQMLIPIDQDDVNLQTNPEGQILLAVLTLERITIPVSSVSTRICFLLFRRQVAFLKDFVISSFYNQVLLPTRQISS